MKALVVLAALGFLGGCSSMEAHRVKGEPMPPRYYADSEPIRQAPGSPGSLWAGESLFTDYRARRVNDLITILVVEKTAGTKNADTKTESKTHDDRSVSTLFGLPLDLGIKSFLGLANPFSPNVSAESDTKVDNKGKTTRDGTLTASITAKVAEVLPNGNLVIEARKETLVNNENQILVLRGTIRPRDIRADNTIYSTYIADAKIAYTGEGVLDDKQGVGWGTRFLDKVWPS